MAAGLKQTMDDARKAMSAFAENMEALKHNFLVRGFFKDRGFFNLADISPAAYRDGALTRGGLTRASRAWLEAAVLFEAAPEIPGDERLTADGKAQLDAASAPFSMRLTGVLMVEGYAQAGTRDQLYLRSRVRASLVRDYFIAIFGLTPQTVGVMPLGPRLRRQPKWRGVGWCRAGALRRQQCREGTSTKVTALVTRACPSGSAEIRQGYSSGRRKSR